MAIKKVLADVKRAAREKYAWPGGYPLFIVMTDGEALCVTCARKEYKLIAASTRSGSRDGWEAGGVDINYEDSELFCANCNNQIEAAYDE